MGQQEVYELLKNKRLSGNDEYFTVAQIRKYFMEHHSESASMENMARSVNRLRGWGLIERRTIDGVNVYRFKKSALEQSSL